MCLAHSEKKKKKVAFQFFKASLTIETEQKPKIAGDWALMRSTTSLLTAENIWCFFLPPPPLQGRELTEPGSKNAGWEDWKREGGVGECECVCVCRKGCCPFICVCLTATVERGKKKGGWNRGRDRKRMRDSLKQCLYAFESWTTPLTSKCFHYSGVWFHVYVCMCVSWVSVFRD